MVRNERNSGVTCDTNPGYQRVHVDTCDTPKSKVLRPIVKTAGVPKISRKAYSKEKEGQYLGDNLLESSIGRVKISVKQTRLCPIRLRVIGRSTWRSKQELQLGGCLNMSTRRTGRTNTRSTRSSTQKLVITLALLLSTTEGEREFTVDSGASLHMMGKNDLNTEEASNNKIFENAVLHYDCK